MATIGEMASAQLAIPASVWCEYLEPDWSRYFPDQPEHHRTGYVAAIVMPVFVGSDNQPEAVLPYSIHHGLVADAARTGPNPRTSAFGWPGGKVTIDDLKRAQNCGISDQPRDVSYVFGGSGDAALNRNVTGRVPGLGLEAVLTCGARELEEETFARVVDPKLVALVGYYGIRYTPKPDQNHVQATQYVATLVVDATNLETGTNPTGRRETIAVPHEPIPVDDVVDRMVEAGCSEGNIHMYKRAIGVVADMGAADKCLPPVYIGKITYPIGEGWKGPKITDTPVYLTGRGRAPLSGD